MRIFLVGDWYSGTGPANVTKYYIENLPKKTLSQRYKSKYARLFELIIKSVMADVICFSGYSKQNIIGMRFAKLIKKPTAYIMHGCVEYENKINLEESEEMAICERKMLELCNCILAVSEKFACWLKNMYPQHSYKIDYVTNAIDDNLIEQASNVNDCNRDKHMILSVGGGMPRKKIKHICEAIDILRKEYDDKLMLVVVGASGADSEEINKYDFVDNRGLVPFEEVKKLYQTASVFVQNSCFETFGLASVEAITLGCATLSSSQLGALELISEIREEDVIEHFDDSREIANKIRYLLGNSNNDYLLNRIDWESNTWKQRSKVLEEKLYALAQ